MDQLGVIILKVLATTGVLLALWLIMEKRQLGEFTPFDFIVSITAGTIAGAGIIDPRIDIAGVLVSLMVLGGMQVALSWLSLKFRPVYRKLNHQPAVLVNDGQIIKQNLKKSRMTVELLLQLLREKGIFDIHTVELAILEPHGKLSVLPKAEYLPLTASSLDMAVSPNNILTPVVIEGELQEDVLRKMGLSEQEITALKEEYGENMGNAFIALMDKDRKLYMMREDISEKVHFH